MLVKRWNETSVYYKKLQEEKTTETSIVQTDSMLEMSSLKSTDSSAPPDNCVLPTPIVAEAMYSKT